MTFQYTESNGKTYTVTYRDNGIESVTPKSGTELVTAAIDHLLERAPYTPDVESEAQWLVEQLGGKVLKRHPVTPSSAPPGAVF